MKELIGLLSIEWTFVVLSVDTDKKNYKNFSKTYMSVSWRGGKEIQ